MEKPQLIQNLKSKKFPPNVVEAFEKVRREDFLPDNFKIYAYEDVALPLEDGSTISQPYTVAFMLQLLEPKQGQRILEIGSGSGYALSLISEIIKAGKIYGVELNKNLAIKSQKLLSKDSNICIFNRSGFQGLLQYAPYDRILFSASCTDMRIPYNILDQLKPEGIMVVPVQSSIFQIKKSSDSKISKQEFPGFAFVPLRRE
tara:strand:- start:57 stop:662 length:606 start_codon:yes stop_codon:yes gene_type:complete